MIFNFKLHNSNHKGFTLLEMIVSLGIFSIVAVIAVGSLVRITSLNRQAQSTLLAVYNVNYILESISREMRFGSNFHCFGGRINWTSSQLNSLGSQSCPAENATKGIVFYSPKPGTGGTCQLAYVYWLVRETSPQEFTIKKDQQTDCNDSLVYDEATSLIDTRNVILDNTIDLSVTVGAGGYSFASIKLSGYSGIKENERNNFNLRTSISQRIRDL